MIIIVIIEKMKPMASFFFVFSNRKSLISLGKFPAACGE